MSTSEAGLKEVGETSSSSRVTHSTDKLGSGEGTSDVVLGSEQSLEQVDVQDGVYGPWIVVARRKHRTKLLKRGGTSPRQSNGFSFNDNGNVEKGSSDRAIVLDGPTREAMRKLSPLKLLDKAQIASAVQSNRPNLAQI